MKPRKPKPFKNRLHKQVNAHDVGWYINTQIDIMTVQDAKKFKKWLTQAIKWLEHRYRTTK